MFHVLAGWNLLSLLLSRKAFIDTSGEIFVRWPFYLRSFIYVIWGHSRSPTVFLTCDQKEIEAWDWCQCVCLVNTHRLIYNMTYLVTIWPWPTLTWGQILPWLFKSYYTCLDAPWRNKHNDATEKVVISFKSKTLSSKKNILVKIDFLTSGDLSFDLSLKMTKIVS